MTANPTSTGQAAARPADRTLELDKLIDDPTTRIVVTCGAGGVGKTTTAAALGLRAAERGRKVVVLTIDPARRLAQSLGLTELDNTPRSVADVDRSRGGRLDAMMLDMKRTFDDVVLAHAAPEKAEQILANPFYVALSSSFAGTQEYMAMEKLGQLHSRALKTGEWDLIVVDTPPSRSALDFLDAPERLASLLEGRFLRLLLAPARGPFRLMSAGVNLAMSVMNKVLGAQVLTDVQTFVAAFDTLFGGFRERAEKTVSLLRQPHTAFLVVAAPQNDALREASYFAERLRAERMPLAGVVLNRVTTTQVPDLSAGRSLTAAEGLREDGGSDLTAAVLQLHADRMQQVVSDRKRADRFRRGHRAIATVEVPTLADDVHDLAGLRAVGDLLAG